ncbi:MAG: NAD(P)/FAD-dependent oxidoreductase [Gammaproteobacteria bacterium]
MIRGEKYEVRNSKPIPANANKPQSVRVSAVTDRQINRHCRSPKLAVIIVGAGPVGQCLSEELLRRKAPFEIKLFGDEPSEPYNREQLSSLLAGSVDFSDLLNPLTSASSSTSLEYINSRVSEIDPDNRSVTDQEGRRYAYDRLVLATGSRASLPALPGSGLAGVYTFRTLRDAEALRARLSRARHIVVVGGGDILGVEVAYALAKSSTEITLVQHGERLLKRRLDQAAAAELHRRIESKGIRLVLNQRVRLIKGDQRVEGITTRFGECIPCDTVVFCTGVEPNIELAIQSGIRVQRGIVVDDHLRTSAKNVFAIGECCEHCRNASGVVAAGLEQARVLADRLTGGKSVYSGSEQVIGLKVLGGEVTSIGTVTESGKGLSHKELVYRPKAGGNYRKLVLDHGRVIGALGVGFWPESGRIHEAVRNRRYLFPWQRWKFRVSGLVWNDLERGNVRL